MLPQHNRGVLHSVLTPIIPYLKNIHADDGADLQTPTNTNPAPSVRGLPLLGATSPALPTAGHEGGRGGGWHQAGLQTILLATNNSCLWRLPIPEGLPLDVTVLKVFHLP